VPHGFNIDGGVHEIPLTELPAVSALPAVTGRLWLCGKHAVAPAPEALLHRIGADTVVCLTERHELAERYPSYVEWLDGAAPSSALWFPIHDLHAPPIERARILFDDLLGRLRHGDGLLVHCAAGIGRAGTTAAALLVLLGCTVDEALDHVRRHRPMAGPEVGEQLDLIRRLADDQPPRRA
jgi:protein-tyrosine phosphatase